MDILLLECCQVEVLHDVIAVEDDFGWVLKEQSGLGVSLAFLKEVEV